MTSYDLPLPMYHVAMLVAVGLGGFSGAVTRYLVSAWIGRSVPEGLAFLGTLCVNLVGCFLIGVLAVAATKAEWMSPLTRRCLVTGVLGSLTTYSTFSYEAFSLLHEDRVTVALLYVGSSVLLGLLLVWLGMTIGQQMFPAKA